MRMLVFSCQKASCSWAVLYIATSPLDLHHIPPFALLIVTSTPPNLSLSLPPSLPPSFSPLSLSLSPFSRSLFSLSLFLSRGGGEGWGGGGEEKEEEEDPRTESDLDSGS